MAKITLSSGFYLLPEGEIDLTIKEVEYKEDFGKLTVLFKDAEDHSHKEFYNLLKKDGSPNDGALTAFSFLAKAALADDSLTEIDPTDIVGCSVHCEVTHDEYNNRTYAHVGNFSPSEEVSKEPSKPSKPEGINADDLDDLLNS